MRSAPSKPWNRSAAPIELLADARLAMQEGLADPETRMVIEATVLLVREAAAAIIEEKGHRLRTDALAMVVRNINLGIGQ